MPYIDKVRHTCIIIVRYTLLCHSIKVDSLMGGAANAAPSPPDFPWERKTYQAGTQ